ncbi:phosphoribosylaminoimidazolecarboxamide formyltransferase [Shuttleworthella satelles]|nr:phosphoribosylaminoimidazolecarboxamide formyltransferase [Shuttleworthia satelles]
MKESGMKELELKYGCNPNQKPSRIFMENGSDLPVTVLNGRPGYINFLDALNGWQLVSELKRVTGIAAASSFKHVSPAGAALGLPLSDTLRKIYWVDDMDIDWTPLANAYARARGADRMSSFGDFIALSDECDVSTAQLIKREVSDGVIAPSYSKEALAILREKKKGSYNVIQIDPSYVPAPLEVKQVYGISFEQGRNELNIDETFFDHLVSANKNLPASAKRDLAISMITLKYTQSNSVCYVKDGQAIGIGAGQQSRIHCTRLAGQKADNWWLRQNPRVMGLSFLDGIKRADRDNAIDLYIGDEYEDLLADGAWQKVFTSRPPVFTAEEKRAWLAENHGVALGSDAFFPFGDNIERAHKSGVSYVAEPGGSIRDDNVIACCDKYGMTLSFTGIRLFHH